MLVAHIGKLQENTTTLCKIAAKLSGYALSDDLDMSDRGSWNASSPIRHQALDVKYPDGMCRMWDIRVEWRRSRIPDMRHSGGMAAEQLHPDFLKGYVVRSPIRTPSGRSTRYSRSSHPDDSISYPDMLSRWPPMVCPDALSLTMDSKELSSISDCFGDQKAIKT